MNAIVPMRCYVLIFAIFPKTIICPKVFFQAIEMNFLKTLFRNLKAIALQIDKEEYSEIKYCVSSIA